MGRLTVNRSSTTRRWVVLHVALLAVALGLVVAATPAAAFTQADVDAGITKGVSNLDSQVDKTDPSNVHWNSSGGADDETQTAFAIAAIGAANVANPNTVSPQALSDAKAAVQWLIKQQDTTTGESHGSIGTSTPNYTTSISLMALSFFSGEPGAQNAINAGRAFEISEQNAPPATTGNPNTQCTAPSSGDYGNCGSWTYSPTSHCCGDASNTGFAESGLDFSGGVPGPTAQANLAWARATEEINTNPYATLNDGGGSYQPGESGGSCCRSSANDTGTLLFSLAYDGVPASDQGAAAAIALSNDILDTLELDKSASPREGVVHNPPAQVSLQNAAPAPGSQRDGACQPGVGSCDWSHDGDGGYHYALFALSKGLGSYFTADITDPNNFYSKVADLLLTEQVPDGSWPANLRDDGSGIGATSFAILALTKAGQLKAFKPVPPTTVVTLQPQTRPAPGCVDLRRFKFKLHHAKHARVVRVRVYVNKKLVKTKRGHNLRSLTIGVLPKQTWTVKIVADQSSGSKLTSRRTYHLCTKTKPKTKAHHHKRHH